MAPVEAEVLAEVARRRAEGEEGRKDAVSILVEARNEDGSPLSEKDLRDELLTLLTDGPTSSSLAWVFERLLRHPEKLSRLQSEVLAGEGGRLPRRGDQGDAAAAATGLRSSSAACSSRRPWVATSFPPGRWSRPAST